MQDSRTRILMAGLLMVIFALLVAMIVVAERPKPAAATPDVGKIQTQAIRAFIAELTAAAPTLSPTRLIVSTLTPAAPTALSGTPDCLGLRFVRDVTVPDNTEVSPAEVFTKTWVVENSGTCPWKPGFQVVLVGGLAMGGSPFRVAQTVGPRGSIQVSIKMAAPTNQTGVVQGTWRMADTNGVQFGDAFYVVVVVSGPTRMAGTATALATP